MRPRPHGGLRVAFLLALAALVALGWAWHRDRTRRWEVPGYRDGTFVSLAAGQRAAPGGQVTWMVPVNPRCLRCLATLRHLHEAWARRERRERLVALIVDSPVPPRHEALRALPRIPLWWDRAGLWRRRWGHRLYGELIEFDPGGRYLRTVGAHEALAYATGSSAPATFEKGGP